MPSMPNSVRIAGFILLALLIYFVGSALFRAPAEETTVSDTVSTAPVARAVPQVIVSPAQTKPHTIFATLKGSTEPDREVTVRAETMGTVINASVAEGQAVTRGTLLCGLDVESRAARIAEAEAGVASAKLDYDAAQQLEEKGWTTSNNAAAAKAVLDRAEAGLAAARIELNKTRVTAPFNGVFEARMAERGDFLSVGAPCGRLVDLDPIVIAVDATENERNAIDPATPVAVELATGLRAEGKVRFIARTANEQTRTFRVEIELPNPDNLIAAGLTATVKVGLGEAAAVLMTPASLVLHDDGRVGVRYVDAEELVQFAEVTVVDDAPDGIWVTGIPDGANLLAAGQDFLREGVKVSPQKSQER